MDAALKKILKAVTLELRHLLEGHYDAAGKWHPGDLEDRLAAIGVRRDRESVAVDELGHLPDEDKHARKVVDAYIQLREEAGVTRAEAVAEFVRETAYTWANRLLALRCMEARELIDEVILQKEVYGGRSLEHHRLAQREPEHCTGEDDGRFVMLQRVFAKQAERLPMLFDPQSPGVALRPSPTVLKQCIALLSGTQAVRSHEPATGQVFKAPDSLGWAYQYWNTEEKDRVFEKVRTQKGAKIEGADIVPATQLYTESYMVQFLVQNSLGATWMGMHPDSKLYEQWDYYVRDADRAPVESKPVRELTFLDPACGSGHFLLEAFDLLYAMYEEEGELTEPEAICDAILTQNLYGIDIDARSVQIAEVALWMKAAEKSFDYAGVPTNLVAAVSSHLKGTHWNEFLAGFEKEPSVARVLRKFGESMEHIDELGSLARPNEDLKKIIAEEHAVWEQQVRERKEANYLFPEMRKEAASGKLAFNEITDEDFGDRLFYRARAALDAFTEQARDTGEFQDQFLGREVETGFGLLDILSQKYDVIAANPPYMGTTQLSAAVSSAVAAYENSPDLYCALMLRWLDLQKDGGIGAVVTRADYLTQSECEAMRHRLLERTSLQVLVRLENRVFRDLSNPNAIFFSMQVHTTPRTLDAHVSSVGLKKAEFEGKAEELQRLISVGSSFVKTKQSAFDKLPRNAFALNLPDWGYAAYISHPKFGSFAAARQGLITGDTSRFLRFRWEVGTVGGRWKRYAKGGEFCRWFGNDEWAVDWGENGARLRNFVNAETGKTRSRVQNTEFYFKRGATWSSQTVSAFATRLLEEDSIFDTTGSSTFLLDGSRNCDDLFKMMGVLNSPAFGVLFRAIQPGVHFGEGYLETLPCPTPQDIPDTIRSPVETCIRLQMSLASHDHRSAQFNPSSVETFRAFRRSLVNQLVQRLLTQADLHASEIAAWYIAEDALGVPISEMTRTVRNYGGSPVDGFLTALWNSSSSPTAELQLATHNALEDACVTMRVGPQEIRPQLESLSEDDIPREYLCEIAEDALIVVVLKLVGHQWESATPEVDEWMPDADGIVPLSIVTNSGVDTELTLVDRIRRITAGSTSTTDADFERDASALIGRPLEQWLTDGFFSRHISRFRKRPVAWHIQSGRVASPSCSAYACLAYYHKLDGDLIRKVRKQAEDVRKSFETELRGIASTPSATRSDRQEQRRIYLENGIGELQRFDATLGQLIQIGFGPAPLVPTLRQYAIDDATLALKSRWLRRLSSLVADTALADWQSAATVADIHDELPDWITQTVTHLQHHCATVGIKPPKAKDVGDEPTSADLAPLICAKSAEMLSGSLRCACDVWWKQFDETVLGPLKEQVKEMKNERKEIKEGLGTGDLGLGDGAGADEFRLESSPQSPIPSPQSRPPSPQARDKQLREAIKPIEQKIKRLKAKANELRKDIEAWTSDEPLSWEPWLADQPLFDEVTSIDGRKAPPATIAEFITQESAYIPDINDGVRVNIAPLQKAGILAADVLAKKDVDKAIADRAEWRADERRWVRQGKLPQPGWWPEGK